MDRFDEYALSNAERLMSAVTAISLFFLFSIWLKIVISDNKKSELTNEILDKQCVVRFDGDRVFISRGGDHWTLRGSWDRIAPLMEKIGCSSEIQESKP